MPIKCKIFLRSLDARGQQNDRKTGWKALAQTFYDIVASWGVFEWDSKAAAQPNLWPLHVTEVQYNL